MFSKPGFLREEQSQWNRSNDARKALFRQQWLQVMLREGVDHYQVNITKKKLKIVKAEQDGSLDVLIKDLFEGGDDEDYEYDDGPIGAPQDAEEVVFWANRYHKHVQLIHSEDDGGYLSTKFRFFRRLHFWMKKTAEKISEYENAKEAARVCGYFERFTFSDFVQDPHWYTTEYMESVVESAIELQEIDRMRGSDQEEEDSITSSSDDEDDVIN